MTTRNQDNASIMDQAQHIWSMLDDMSNSDPGAYQRFINKHIKEGKEFMRPPEPHMCVHTVILKDNEQTPLYINICAWPRIPAPATDQSPIPVLGGPMYAIEEEIDGSQGIAIGFNPIILEESGRDAGLREEQRLLVNLCINYIEKQNTVKLSRSYSVLPHSCTYRGTLHQIRQTLLIKTQDSDQQFEKELGQLEKSFGPLASGVKDSLLNQLSNMTVGGDSQSEPTIQKENGENQPEIRLLPTSAPYREGLIQEVDSSDGNSWLPGLPEPEYSLQLKDSDSGGPQRYILRVNLPDVKSVAECELDISQDDISLLVPDGSKLHLNLPATIDVSQAGAKFSKKTGTLIISMPTIQ